MSNEIKLKIRDGMEPYARALRPQLIGHLPPALDLSPYELNDSASFINCLRSVVNRSRANSEWASSEDINDYAPSFLVALAQAESKKTHLPVGVLAVTCKALNGMSDAQLLAWVVRLMSKNPAINNCDHVRVLLDPYSSQPFVAIITICEMWHDVTRGSDGRFRSIEGMWVEREEEEVPG